MTFHKTYPAGRLFPLRMLPVVGLVLCGPMAFAQAAATAAGAGGPQQPGIAKGDVDTVVSHWTLAFRKRTVPPYVTTATTPGDSDPGPLAQILGGIYQDVRVVQHGDTLVISGPKERVRRVKTLVAKWIDVPYPQVRLNALTFQATAKSYNSEELVDKIQLARAGIELTRLFTNAYLNDFHAFMMNTPDLLRTELQNDQEVRKLFGKFHLLNYANPTNQPWLAGVVEPSNDNKGGDAYETLAEGLRHRKPFVDELAYITMARRTEFFGPGSNGRSKFQEAMATGRAAAFLAAQRTNLENSAKKIAEKFKNAKEPAQLKGLKRAQFANELLLDLVGRLSDNLARPSALFNQGVRVNFADQVDEALVNITANQIISTLLSFMHEHSLPNTYEELNARVRQQRRRGVAREELKRCNDQNKQASDALNDARARLNQAREDVEWFRSQLTETRTKQQEARIGLKAALSAQRDVAKEQADIEAAIAELEKQFKGKKMPAKAKSNLESLKQKLEKVKAKAAVLKKKVDTQKSDLADLDALVDKLPKQIVETIEGIAKMDASIAQLKGKCDEMSQKVASARVELDALNAEFNHSERIGLFDQVYNRPVDPELLAMLSVNLDKLILQATQAFSKDILDGIVTPLKEWVEFTNKDGRGLIFTGNVELAVTSSQGAASGGSSSYNAPNSPIPQLTEAQAQALLGITKGTSFFSAEGFATLMIGLAALNEDGAYKTPTYTNLAPNLDMAVVPSVLAGSESARLQINVKSSVTVSDPDTTKKTHAPIDYVKSHETRTDVAVEAFDLFPLSTFKIETTVQGDPAWQIPILEGLPIIGRFFVGPRRPITMSGHSLIIAYTTIVPRSLDIARRYSSASN